MPLRRWVPEGFQARGAGLPVLHRHPAPDPGMRTLQQLVADAHRSDVRDGADAVPLLRGRLVHGLLQHGRGERLGGCCKISHGILGSGKHWHTGDPASCSADTHRSHGYNVCLVCRPWHHCNALPKSKHGGRMVMIWSAIVQ